MTEKTHRPLIALILILWLAFGLRIVQLDRQPLWWDEGLNLFFSRLQPSEVLSEMIATNHADPPLFPLMTAGWVQLVGSSPFAVRTLSVLLGTLTVALSYAIGRWLLDSSWAQLAAILMALSPMQVYFGREAKGYLLVCLLALLSTYAWGRQLGYANRSHSASQHNLQWWLVYILSSLGALAAHYYVAPLLLWQGAWTLGMAQYRIQHGWEKRRAWTGFGRWLGAAACVALLLLPWVVTAFSTTVRGVTGVSQDVPLSLWPFLKAIGSTFGGDLGGSLTPTVVSSWALVLLVTLGAAAGVRRAFLASWLAIPVAGAFVLQTRFSFFFPRFLLYLTPAYYLLATAGCRQLQRKLPDRLVVGAGILLVVLWLAPLSAMFAAPVDSAEDPRPAIDQLAAAAQPSDGVVYVYIWQIGYLSSYFPEGELDYFRAYYTPETVGTELTHLFADHPRLWLLSYKIAPQDTHNLSGYWLASNAYQAESGWYGNHHVSLYLSPDTSTKGVGPTYETVLFQGGIELEHPLISSQLAPGGSLALPLRWKPQAKPSEDYQVFVHLGLPGQPPVAQSDGAPVNGLLPTSQWEPGDVITDRRALLMPDSIPPGQYNLSAGLYRLSDGGRLTLDSGQGNAATVGVVMITP